MSVKSELAKLTPLQRFEIKEKYVNWFYFNEKFVDYFMKDDAEMKFSVPTRNHRVIDNVPEFQSEIFKKLDDIHLIKRIAIASPRSFMKSTSCSVEFPLRCASFGHYKEILIVSNSEALAINFLRSIKINFESNERINRVFGNQVSDKWTENHIITCGSKMNPRTSIRAVGWGAQIRGFRPDLIIMDLIMPEMGGLEACEMLDKDSLGIVTPIIILSGIDKDVDKVKAFKLGVVDYVVKPISRKDLMRVVDKAVSSKTQN